MPTRRAIASVLHDFLGTYTSRHSDYNGYWLFGFMVEKFNQLEFDLLGPSPALTEPLFAVAADLAVVKFARQLALAGLGRASLREARLVITRLPDRVEGQVNAHRCTGHMVRLRCEPFPITESRMPAKS